MNIFLSIFFNGQARLSFVEFGYLNVSLQEIQDDLKAWNVEIEPELFKLKGRLLAPEKIANSRTSVMTYEPANADWTRRKFAVIRIKQIGNVRNFS